MRGGEGVWGESCERRRVTTGKMPPRRVPKNVKVWNEDLIRAAQYRYYKAGELLRVSVDILRL